MVSALFNVVSKRILRRKAGYILRGKREKAKQFSVFKRKAQVGMQSDEKKKIETQVHADEFVVGGKEEDKPGRSLSNKKATMILMEKIDEKTVGRIYLQQIENYQADTLKYAIKEHVSDMATITADQYPSYES